MLFVRQQWWALSGSLDVIRSSTADRHRFSTKFAAECVRIHGVVAMYRDPLSSHRGTLAVGSGDSSSLLDGKKFLDFYW